MSDEVSIGELRVWGGNAGWQDSGKSFVVVSKQKKDLIDILQDGKIVQVRNMFIMMFSDVIRD